MDRIYRYFRYDQLHYLQWGYWSFRPAPNACHVFDQDIEPFTVAVKTHMNDELFGQHCQSAYDALPAAAQKLMSLDYFTQQATADRSKYESAFLQQQQPQRKLARPAQTYQGLGWLTFSRRIDLDPAWHIYADQHRGFALELSTDDHYWQDPQYANAPQTFAPICYQQLRPGQNDGRFAPFLSKPEAWQWEQGIRLIRPLSASQKHKPSRHGDDYHLFKLPIPCIKGIIFGAAMPQEHRQKLQSLLRQDRRYHKIAIKQCRLDASEYQFHLQEL